MYIDQRNLHFFSPFLSIESKLFQRMTKLILIQRKEIVRLELTPAREKKYVRLQASKKHPLDPYMSTIFCLLLSCISVCCYPVSQFLASCREKELVLLLNCCQVGKYNAQTDKKLCFVICSQRQVNSCCVIVKSREEEYREKRDVRIETCAVLREDHTTVGYLELTTAILKSLQTESGHKDKINSLCFTTCRAHFVGLVRHTLHISVQAITDLDYLVLLM